MYARRSHSCPNANRDSWMYAAILAVKSGAAAEGSAKGQRVVSVQLMFVFYQNNGLIIFAGKLL